MTDVARLQRFQDLGARVLGFGTWGLGFRVSGSGMSGSRFRILGRRYRFRVCCLRVRVYSFWVWGLWSAL